MGRSIFIASTGQHVGKTTSSLGLIAGFKERGQSVSFMKPVGQEYTLVEGEVRVDKDVELMHELFKMHSDYALMSPVLLPSGFTREFLDGDHPVEALEAKILSAFRSISKESNWTIIEGTGHVGVGSIVGLNNAQVARLLKTPMILVASGGLGSCFDQLALNCAMCEKYGVPILGIILNRVLPDKREMIVEYMGKALKAWDLPIVGCIPFDEILSNPSMEDFETLFRTTLLTGGEFHFRRFKEKRLVATSLERFEGVIGYGDLIITPATREDIVEMMIAKNSACKEHGPDMGLGLILTGLIPPSEKLCEKLEKAAIPMLFAKMSSYSAMEKISSFTAKFRRDDIEKVSEGIAVVKEHLNFNLIEARFDKLTMR